MTALEKFLVGAMLSYMLLYLLDICNKGFSSTNPQSQPRIRLTDWDVILGRNSKVRSREELQGGDRPNPLQRINPIMSEELPPEFR